MDTSTNEALLKKGRRVTFRLVQKKHQCSLCGKMVSRNGRHRHVKEHQQSFKKQLILSKEAIPVIEMDCYGEGDCPHCQGHNADLHPGYTTCKVCYHRLKVELKQRSSKQYLPLPEVKMNCYGEGECPGCQRYMTDLFPGYTTCPTCYQRFKVVQDSKRKDPFKILSPEIT